MWQTGLVKKYKIFTKPAGEYEGAERIGHIINDRDGKE